MNEEYLKPTEFIDSNAPEVQAFALNAVTGAKTPREKAVKLTMPSGMVFITIHTGSMFPATVLRPVLFCVRVMAFA